MLCVSFLLSSHQVFFHGSSIENKNMQGPGQLSPGQTLRFPEVFLALPFNPFGIKGLKGKVCQLTPDLLTSASFGRSQGEREVQKTVKIMRITIFSKNQVAFHFFFLI